MSRTALTVRDRERRAAKRERRAAEREAALPLPCFLTFCAPSIARGSGLLACDPCWRRAWRLG